MREPGSPMHANRPVEVGTTVRESSRPSPDTPSRFREPFSRAVCDAREAQLRHLGAAGTMSRSQSWVLRWSSVGAHDRKLRGKLPSLRSTCDRWRTHAQKRWRTHGRQRRNAIGRRRRRAHAPNAVTLPIIQRISHATDKRCLPSSRRPATRATAQSHARIGPLRKVDRGWTMAGGPMRLSDGECEAADRKGPGRPQPYGLLVGGISEHLLGGGS